MSTTRPNPARRATAEDAEELVRLRTVMLDSLPKRPGANPDTTWRPVAVETLRGKLNDPDGDLTAFVVDSPAGTGLAACAVGTIEYRLGGPGNPGGTTGYVFSVATDPDQRRRGHARACTEALLGWFRERGVPQVDLRASVEAEPLYASLGFARTPDPAMRLRL